jgi:gas vesicle protein
MDERTMSFNEGQLKRSGFAEAFNADLIDKMEKRLPLIQHSFSKEFDGDKVSAVLHLKKSSTSDHYFLNKFDLSLQKEAQLSQTKQTFYVNRKPVPATIDTDRRETYENRFTLKEAYNLLAGRPVFKNLVNNEGVEYQAWVKLNLKNKQENGNHEVKQYTKNYGFDLETILAKYSIKELATDQYKQSLIDSLHRGNLQKATFIDRDGKEERMYVSPHVSLGMLNVYDQDKQRITTDILVEKQYIGNDLANNIRERLAIHDKKISQNSESREAQTPELKEKHEQKPKKVDQKQKNDDPVKKQSKKQKVT